MSVELSIIIVNWNSGKLLSDATESILRNPPSIDFEIIVVDNNSTDGSLSNLPNFERSTIIRNKYNYGFAAANNQGFKCSEGRFVMPLNPDTLVSGATLETLVNAIQGDSTIGLVAPTLLSDGNMEAPISTFPLFPKSRFFAIFSSRIPRTNRKPNSHMSESNIDFVDWVVGTGYIVRKSAIDSDQLFDETTFLFSEEYYLNERIRKAGYRLAVLKTAAITHFKSVTFKNDPERSRYATNLMVASTWKARKDIFGPILAALSHGYIALDTFMTLITLKIWYQLWAVKDDQKLRFLDDLYTIFKSSIKSVILGEKHFDNANLDARLFFNDGVNPPNPPIPFTADVK